MATGGRSTHHQRLQRQIRRRNRMIDQRADHQHKAELLEENDNGDIFENMMEKSAAFFDSISISDSVTSNPFVSTSSVKASDARSDATNRIESEFNDARDESSSTISPNTLGLMLDAERQCASPVSSSKPIDDPPVMSVDSINMLESDIEEMSLDSAEHKHDEIAAVSMGTVSRQDEANIDLISLDDIHDASSQPSAAVKSNVTIDVDYHDHFDTRIELHDTTGISVDPSNMMESDFEEISLSSADNEDNEVHADSDIRQGDANVELAKLNDERNITSPEVEASAAAVKSNVTVNIGYQALFDTDSDEIEEIEELHRHIDDVSTLTEETYSLSNGHKPFFAPYSSKPLFSFAEMQVDGMQRQDGLAANRRRSRSAEVLYMQRLEEIAAQRSFIAQIAIKFEDVVMAVCGQEEEVLFLVDEEDEEEGKEELMSDNKSSASKPMVSFMPEAKNDQLETPIHEKAMEENADACIGMAGLLKTIQISRVGKLTTKDRVLVPLYERAVLHLVSLENQVMRKARAIETGKRALASCTHEKERLNVATNIAFLEVELKETKRKVVQSRESLQRLYEAFSHKTQKAIDDLQMDGFRYNDS